MKQYLFTIILTASITFALTWAVWRLSLKFKLYPGIRERDVHKTPTPRLGGIAMFIGIAAAILISAANPFFERMWSPPQTLWSILGAALLIAVIGVIDDLWDLDWMIKLAAQFLAAGIITAGGGLQILSLPVGDMILVSPWVSISITMFAIVVVMNAVNFIDGLDGLVAGVCLIANGVFFVYAYMLTRDSGATSYFNLATFLAAVLIGACIGFLPLNWTPAKLFMGDSGALVLGLLMATSAIALTGQGNAFNPEQFGRSQLLGAFIPIVLPLVIVMLPLLDFGLAVFRRMRAGKSPFSPDRKHLHHRMLDVGHHARDAVLIFYAWTAVISLSVLLMYIGTRQDWPGGYLVGVGFGVVGVAACLVVTLMPPKRRPAASDTPKSSVSSPTLEPK
ncbi:Undecaprenyl-phosphate N-acetylglucosaminyl 1-phosphate transferase [Microbacterium esteraromaticum]|uniref:Undecaprenyl-phosphate N-acetylglucosaminyl 1-phosphate transferase n=1 Tax=Microbacterium esteraromaticum TaxID=57043 RepID=A0A1R4JI99_9MICO|nr:MraY family glycosyltransferase [Microbacterium esteraromaticum]SJN31790.1 Undecaprenyl-phosphate N-acetylglucosaminyl 1-phosphate transferase [Microbacterium esteraromaticum]